MESDIDMKDTNEWEENPYSHQCTKVKGPPKEIPQPMYDPRDVAFKCADPVNHPRHYTNHPSGVECIQITEHYNFCIGNAIKYLWRAGLKEGNSNVQDLKKAIWYIQRELDNDPKV